MFFKFFRYETIFVTYDNILASVGVLGEISELFPRHGNRFLLCISIGRLFVIRMIKSVKVFTFSQWKLILI
jgi:hypothetical protein